MTMSSTDVKVLLNKHKSLKYDETKKKVVCQLTKHEMPITEQAIESYVKGKKYQKALTKAFDFDQYKPHIVPSTKKNHGHELFCCLTLRHIAKTQQAVERHVRGKKYKRAFARWTKCQETGEKFVPRGGKSKRAGDFDGKGARKDGAPNWTDDSASEDNADDDDDLEDLYPAEVFGGESGDEDEENDDEDNEDEDEIDVSENSETEVSANSKTPIVESPVEDGDSDYDIDILDGKKDEGADNRLHGNVLNAHKNKGKKGNKNLKRANADSLESNGGVHLHSKNKKHRKNVENDLVSKSKKVQKKKK